VPPQATVVFEVELVDMQNAKESWEMQDAEKVEAAAARKEKGNTYFKAGRMQQAIAAWDKAVGFIAYDKTFPDEVKTKVKEIKRSIWLNLAAAHLKLSEWKLAAENAGKVLELDPFHVKALYRQAQALMGTQDYVEAEEAVKKGLSVEAHNTDLQALLKKLKVAMKDQQTREKAIFSKMFASKSKPAATTATTTAPEAPMEEAAA
jgi:FK506-binding protein 4/5